MHLIIKCMFLNCLFIPSFDSPGLMFVAMMVRAGTFPGVLHGLQF